MDKIYDDSGIIVGEAAPIGEQRPEVESTDVELAPEFPKHDAHSYTVEEADNMIDRSFFICAYLSAKEKCPFTFA